MSFDLHQAPVTSARLFNYDLIFINERFRPLFLLPALKFIDALALSVIYCILIITIGFIQNIATGGG